MAMPKRSTLKLTKRIVERLKAEGKDAIFRDRELAGVGAQVTRMMFRLTDPMTASAPLRSSPMDCGPLWRCEVKQVLHRS